MILIGSQVSEIFRVISIRKRRITNGYILVFLNRCSWPDEQKTRARRARASPASVT